MRRDPDNPTVRVIKGPAVPLRSGNYFDYLDPEGSSFTIEDIAWNLSMLCRSNGATSQFYSVAQHSCYVSFMVARTDPALARTGLLHDAAEFVMGDMTKPLKTLCPDYVALEKRIEAVVFARLNVPTPLPLAIEEADRRMLATEQAQLYDPALRDHTWQVGTAGQPPYDVKLPNWGPAEAYSQFMLRYHTLGA